MKRLQKVGAGVGIVSGILIAFAVVGYAMSGGKSQSGGTDSLSGANPIQQDSASPLKINDTTTISGISYNVTRASVSSNYPGAGLPQRSDGGRYIAVQILVKNIDLKEKPELHASDFS